MSVRGAVHHGLSTRWATGLSGWLLVLGSGCVPAAPVPGPAQLRTTAPPWDAPRDAVSYIDAANLPAQSVATTVAGSRTVTLTVVVDASPVTVPAGIGVDAVRALQAPAHTHDDSGTVSLEGERADRVTLGQFFTLWGVRYDAECLGAACGSLSVTSDGEPVADPVGLPLTAGADITVMARS